MALLARLGEARADLNHLVIAREGRSLALVSLPNIRPCVGLPAEKERKRLERNSRISHLVKARDEDLMYCYLTLSPAEAAHRLLSLGTEPVVVTYGADGAIDYRLNQPPPVQAGVKVDVVDTVGAGDAFCAGLISGLATESALRVPPTIALKALDNVVLRRIRAKAVHSAAITCSRQGADPPTAEDVAKAVY